MGGEGGKEMEEVQNEAGPHSDGAMLRLGRGYVSCHAMDSSLGGARTGVRERAASAAISTPGEA